MKYEAVVGLEVHVQVRTQSKMFCACANGCGGAPNTRVCPVCLGYPGVLPVINREAVRKTLLAGMMCHCEIPAYSKFDRKNYYYPDMPKNYQISQYDLPFCAGGSIRVGGIGFSGNPIEPVDLGLTRMHLEEDVGKSTHLGATSAVDFNRAGIPLLEIVSEPDMRSADHAYAYLSALREIMQYGGIGDCDMEKGQMRCDVNISVRPEGESEFGTKIEIKNLNSLRAVHRSIEFEVERQIDALENGELLSQETRRWDDAAGMTTLMRTKEHAHDYRYFPEPDLMPIEIPETWLDEIRRDIPELPAERRRRFVAQFGITEYDAQVLTQDKNLAAYFEAAAERVGVPKAVANWIQTELLGALAESSLDISDSPVGPEALAELVQLIENQTVSGRIAKDVFADMFETGKDARTIVQEKGLEQVSDSNAIEQFVDQAITDNPGPVEEYRSGKPKAIQFLVGQVMKKSKGKANPKLVVEMLKNKLDS